MLRTYACLSKLRLHNISPYIPEILGIYLAPYSETFKKESRYGDRIVREGKPMVRIWEMDYLDKSYEDEYGKSSKKFMEPRVTFEEVIGRWAVGVVAKCQIDDEDGDVLGHHMLYYDPNYVVYHIADKLYLFEPGYSPRQVDYDDGSCRDSNYSLKHHKEGSFPIRQDTYYQSSYMYERTPTHSIKKFLEEIEMKGLFQSLKENLVEFEVSPTNPIPATDNVQHFYIPEEYI
ncbi:hypothetical protein Aasi_0937 [Candidatus Amoebophilus asiaticus 5a2]|uniref:Uncharacterized protein n=1 Tax=Amoebophilus asiaticus (strain 5a2) TaxID=452471 RepID=B3ESU7_AMOA5|nr:hypothetical protein [Candidatus Amoebophilus asiaticus]ACE06299.1 hypothetical protein Aasi_0937 [Candidatus Amoebophilus asiaticus 5a2]